MWSVGGGKTGSEDVLSVLWVMNYTTENKVKALNLKRDGGLSWRRRTACKEQSVCGRYDLKGPALSHESLLEGATGEDVMMEGQRIQMKIVFMGTPDFMIPTLWRPLIRGGHRWRTS